MSKLDLNSIPRLIYDYKTRQEDHFFLVYIERIGLTIAVNYSALSIIELCNGNRTLSEIIDITNKTFKGAVADFSNEVMDFIQELTTCKLITFDKITYETPSARCFDPVKGLYPLIDAISIKDYGGTGPGGSGKCKRGQN